MIKLLISTTLIILLVMGALLTVTVFKKRDNLSSQTEIYDSSFQKLNN